MTRHTHTIDFTEDRPAMRERDLLRTAESLADDLDANLAAMQPRDEPTAAEWAEGFRDFVLLAVMFGGGMLFGQFLWSM